jgi:histidinol-phosphate aminotransferase
VSAADLLSLAVPGVRKLRPYVPGKPVETLEREYGVRNAVKLASNENPLGPSAHAIEAIRKGLGDLGRYPDGNGFVLKSALAHRLGVTQEQITLGNGSNDVLELVARAFAGPGDEVVFSQYAFAVYPIVAQAVGARPVAVAARDWGHDLDAMAAAVTDRTRVVFVANPNNPTGTWVTAAVLERFLAQLPVHVVVVVDEAYFEYVDDPDYPDSLAWLDRFSNLVVTRTFSKIHGLAALRVGYGVSHPALADLLNRVRQPFNVNSLGLRAATAALGDEAHVARSRETNRAGMAQLCAGFEELGLAHIPSAGNFVTFDTGGPAKALYEALLKLGVIVRPVDNYGMPVHLRVTVGLAEENARFLSALADAMGDRAAS